MLLAQQMWACACHMAHNAHSDSHVHGMRRDATHTTSAVSWKWRIPSEAPNASQASECTERPSDNNTPTDHCPTLAAVRLCRCGSAPGRRTNVARRPARAGMRWRRAPRLTACPGAAHDLRRHPIRRACHRLRPVAGAFEAPADAEVAEVHPAAGGHLAGWASKGEKRGDEQIRSNIAWC